MSAKTKAILARARQMVPPMLESFHKGQLGRVGVIGGSEDYTGAPFFSAMASARLGCDMSHVICTPAAAAVIKTYSPNLMVHPLMRQEPTDAERFDPNVDVPDPARSASPIIDLLSRLHVLVIGPGLGRDTFMQGICVHVLEAARQRGLPVVLDADGLQLANELTGYAAAVLTPNVAEFSRLCRNMGVIVAGEEEEEEGDGDGERGHTSAATKSVEALARSFDGVTVVQKGARDYISNGETTLVSDVVGGRKRSGGQGDTLTGTIATFLAWRKAYFDELWQARGDLGERETVALAAFAGSAITRECSRLAFAKRGRSLQASDLTDEIHTAFLNLFGEEDDGSDAKL